MALSKITNASVADTAVHGRRNLIINGAMQVSQRGNSFTGLGASTSTFTLDRHRFYNYSGEAVFDVTQSSEAPEGFSKSLKVDCTTADTGITATEEILLIHYIEAQNLQHLKYGTSNAEKLTLSFWVRSNVTGTYMAWFYSHDGADHAAQSYTIDTADTWEYKTVTINGNKLSGGTINNDNGHGIGIHFVLGCGSGFQSGTQVGADYKTILNADRYVDQTAQLASSTNNEWYITGIQLEVGDKATPYEHRSFHDELLACMRYYEGTTYSQANANGYALHVWALQEHASTRAFPTRSGNFVVPKRATPTIRIDGSQTGTANELSGYSSGVDYTVSSVQGATKYSVCGYFQMTDAPPTNQHIVCMIEADAEI